MNLTLLVLAAGMGSRYGGLKQIDPVGPGGETIIDYSVYDAARAGFNRLIFVIRRDIEAQFRETIGRRFEGRIAVEYVFQELDKLPPGFSPVPGRTKPWGTGHAILMAADLIREPFAVVNGDDFYGAGSFQKLGEFLRAGTPDYAMVGFELEKTLSEFGSVARGICQISPDGYLQSVIEMLTIERVDSVLRNLDASGQIQPLTGREMVSMNMWGFTPTLFAHLQEQFSAFLRESAQNPKSEFYIPHVVNRLVSSRQERLKVLASTDAWFGVTYRNDGPRTTEGIRKLIAQGKYPEKLHL